VDFGATAATSVLEAHNVRSSLLVGCGPVAASSHAG
jgi:hypothetical protein